MPPVLLALVSLVACTGGGSDTNDTNPPGGGGADQAAYCAEDHRVVVADTSVAADEMSFAAADAIAAETGDFAGPLQPYAEGSAPIDLTLSLSFGGGEVDAVYRVFVDPNAGDTGHMGSGGDPEGSDCPPVYVYTLSGALGSADGSFAGAFTTDVAVSDPSAGQIDVYVPLADMTGTARPTFDVSKWDEVDLRLDATQQDGGWTGSLGWLGTSDTSGDTGGTVSPSGQTEGVGGFTLTR